MIFAQTESTNFNVVYYKSILSIYYTTYRDKILHFSDNFLKFVENIQKFKGKFYAELCISLDIFEKILYNILIRVTDYLILKENEKCQTDLS